MSAQGVFNHSNIRGFIDLFDYHHINNSIFKMTISEHPRKDKWQKFPLKWRIEHMGLC